MRNCWIVSAFYYLVAVASPAQQSPLITVRIINIANGKPVPQRGVLIERINPDTHMPIVEQGMPLKGTTGLDGKVSLSSSRLSSDISAKQSGAGDRSETIPRKNLSKFSDLEITYTGGGIQCSTGLFSLDEILKSGVVGDNRCNRKFDTTKFKSVPGEVIIFVGKYHWWEGGQR